MNPFEEKMKDGDHRSIGHSDEVIPLIDSRESFNRLFELLFHKDRLVVMRTADAIEKITIDHPEYLKDHKTEILNIFKKAEDKELKWHLAQIVSRVELNEKEVGKIWQILTNWTLDPKESRIVRTNAVHGLFNLLTQYPELEQDFRLTIDQVTKENIPSINARLRILKILKR